MEDLELKVGINIEVELGRSGEYAFEGLEEHDQVFLIERYESGRIRKQTTYVNMGGEFKERFSLGWYEEGGLSSSLIHSENQEEYIRWAWDKKGNIVMESYFEGESSNRKLVERMYSTDFNGKNVLEKVFVDGELKVD